MIQRIGSKEIILLCAVSVLVLGAGIAAMFLDASPEWKYYQSEFELVVAEEIGEVDPSQLPKGIQQIWVEDLNLVDRCTTCHLGIDWAGLENVEQPWTTHPDQEIFGSHPFEDFGCTSCHGGQGLALTYEDGHGYVEHWEMPLMGEAVGSEYDPRSPLPLYEVNCNYCHRYERSTPGMPFINHGKQLVRDKGCKICHVINGVGGTLGPDLTFEGDKHAEGYDFSNLVSPQQTIFNWHIKHFQSPETIVPNTIMPEMNFQSRDQYALAMLAMSWRDNTDLPWSYFPGIELKDEMTQEEIERDARMRTGDGAFFVEKSCFVCHSIEAYDIQSPTDKGPDLSWAPDDVRARFSKTVEEFLFNPTGTMEIILGSQIVLTDAEKWEAIEKIMRAYDIVTNRADSLPPGTAGGSASGGPGS
jgi:cytochrome c2